MENYPVFRRAMLHFGVSTHVLLSRSPVPRPRSGPRDLHAGIHVTSVHPELESNSQIKIEFVYSKVNYYICVIIRNNFKKLMLFVAGLELCS